MCYVGQMGWSFTQRFKEHRNEFKSNTLYTYYKTNMNMAKWTVLWPYSNPWITQAYYYLTNNTISNPSTKIEDSFQSRAQEKPTPCSKRSLTPASLMSRSVVLQMAYGYHTTIATLQRNTNTHRTRYVKCRYNIQETLSQHATQNTQSP